MRGRESIVLGLHERKIQLTGARCETIRPDDAESLARFLEAENPSCVIHSAGLTDVEACESEPALAQSLNVDLAVTVASVCAHAAIPLAHISTDHVFDGTRALLTEADPVAPVNVYGRTKAEAEARVLELYDQALVIRTNFYGWGTSYRRSFSDRIIQGLRRSEPVSLFTDVYYTPILAEVLVATVHDLLDRGEQGLFHVTGDERISKFGFGLKVATHFGLDPALLVPTTFNASGHLTTRPLDMSLSNAKVRALTGHPLGGVDEHLRILRQQEQSGLAKEVQSL